jgi:AcrR family transcriptional regulator
LLTPDNSVANSHVITLIIVDIKKKLPMIIDFLYFKPMVDQHLTTDDIKDWRDARNRILSSAAVLIASGGSEAATTRAVALSAGVQAPTIYRLFGDKRGLLDAAAEHVLSLYVAEKAKHKPHPDPVQELRNGWDMHIEFGLANPAIFSIMAGSVGSHPPSPAVAAGLKILEARIRNIALAGRLRVSEVRALALLQAVGNGTLLSLLAKPGKLRDKGLSHAARETVIDAITDDVKVVRAPGPKSAAATLRASLSETIVLTDGERHLLSELLDRVANG